MFTFLKPMTHESTSKEVFMVVCFEAQCTTGEVTYPSKQEGDNVSNMAIFFAFVDAQEVSVFSS